MMCRCAAMPEMGAFKTPPYTLGILSGKTFQQSKGLLQNIKGERR